jgi:hypothetical protein
LYSNGSQPSSQSTIAWFSTGLYGVNLRTVAERAKRNPKLCRDRSVAWGPGGHSLRGTKNTHPASSETFVAATLHGVLKLTLRPAQEVTAEEKRLGFSPGLSAFRVHLPGGLYALRNWLAFCLTCTSSSCVNSRKSLTL